MSYVVHEFALGLFALDFSKEQLMTHLGTKLREIGLDELAVVNAGLGRTNPKAWSDLGLIAFRHAHGRFARQAIADLLRLRRFC
jgi:hypothetical protein